MPLTGLLSLLDLVVVAEVEPLQTSILTTTIIVPPDAPVVTFAPGDKADLKPGTKIFILAAKKLPDGTLQAARVNYGKDGLTPPM